MVGLNGSEDPRNDKREKCKNKKGQKKIKGKTNKLFPCTYFGFTLRSFLLLAGALGAI